MNPTPPLIPGPLHRGPGQAAKVILFLLLGLAPTPITLITLAATASRRLDDGTAVLLVVVGGLLSFVAAFGIVRSLVSKMFWRVLLTLALGLCFCGLNALVSFFTGCLLLVGKSGH